MNPRQCRQCRFYFAGLYAVALIFDLVIAAGSIPQVPIFKVPDITGYKAAMKFLSPKITGSNGGGWWFWSKPSTTTTWTASITATGEGVDISKVEYSTDQTNYKTGTSFTSKSEIKTFYIRVTDSNGNITNWIYENGTTRQL